MKNLPVSVIITAFNEEKVIGACLSSLSKQDYPSMEIIVIDDGSTDKTKEVVKEFKNVSLYTLDHKGTAISRNFGAQKASGDILVFLDADMEFESDFITKLVSPINQGKTKGTFSKLEYVKNWNSPIARCWNWNNTPPLPDKMRIPQNSDEGDDFRAILKTEFEKVRGFDNTGYSDTWSLSQKLKYRPINAENAIYYHKNPETFSEVFLAARWIGKRRYKFGIVGSIIALIRSFIVFSIVKGIYRMVEKREVLFLPFQIAYDLGITAGVFNSLITGSVIK